MTSESESQRGLSSRTYWINRISLFCSTPRFNEYYMPSPSPNPLHQIIWIMKSTAKEPGQDTDKILWDEEIFLTWPLPFGSIEVDIVRKCRDVVINMNILNMNDTKKYSSNACRHHCPIRQHSREVPGIPSLTNIYKIWSLLCLSSQFNFLMDPHIKLMPVLVGETRKSTIWCYNRKDGAE